VTQATSADSGAHGRTLVVMRHAKAEPFANDDHGRQLTERGRRDAAEAGIWLASRGLEPDYVFVSSSARTVGTWEAFAHGARATAEVAVEDALYTASPEAALDVLRTAPLDARVVVFIGHNPTAAYVAHLLDSGDPDPAAFREMSEGYPTAATTVLEVHVPWSELGEGTARIVDFHVGHGAATVNGWE
jgi:phosphohistidine phosphatase